MPSRILVAIGPLLLALLAGLPAQADQPATPQAGAVQGPVSVHRIASAQIESFVLKVGRDRPMVVTVSSTDSACSHCIEANAVVDDASRYLSDSYTFVQIDFDPWRSFSTDAPLADFLSSQGFSINGLPTSYLLKDGQILGQTPTLRGDLRDILVQALPGIAQ